MALDRLNGAALYGGAVVIGYDVDDATGDLDAIVWKNSLDGDVTVTVRTATRTRAFTLPAASSGRKAVPTGTRLYAKRVDGYDGVDTAVLVGA